MTVYSQGARPGAGLGLTRVSLEKLSVSTGSCFMEKLSSPIVTEVLVVFSAQTYNTGPGLVAPNCGFSCSSSWTPPAPTEIPPRVVLAKESAESCLRQFTKGNVSQAAPRVLLGICLPEGKPMGMICCCYSVTWLCLQPRGHQASLSFTISQSLLKLTSIESVMPSNHLNLCRPLLLLPSIFPSIRVFSNESALSIR